jgi:hypothetical protein
MRPPAAALGVVLAACGAGQVSSPPSERPPYNHETAKQLIEAQSNCFAREAQSKSVANVDLETAALAVQARCVAETERFKAYAGQYTIENLLQFQARMRRMEAEDLQTIRQMLALVRTSK